MVETANVGRVLFELDRVILGHGVGRIVVEGYSRGYVFGSDGTLVNVDMFEDRYLVSSGGHHRWGVIDSRMTMRVVAEIVATITQVIVEGVDA